MFMRQGMTFFLLAGWKEVMTGARAAMLTCEVHVTCFRRQNDIIKGGKVLDTTELSHQLWPPCM